MAVIAFLLRESRLLVILTLIASLVAGTSNTVLLGLISSRLDYGDELPGKIVWTFVGLCVLMLLSKLASEMLLIRFALKLMFKLRMKFSRQILSAPLRQLEELGKHRLLASLTQDIPELVNALILVPVVCMNLVIVVACMSYLAWLSWKLFLGVFGFIVIGIAGYKLALFFASRYQRLSREQWDGLFKSYRALTEGVKELKIHKPRREAFLSRSLEPNASALRHYQTIANSIFAGASGWAHLLWLGLIGAIVFGAPSFGVFSVQILITYTVIILFLMGPLEAIVGNLATFSRAGIAISKVESMGLSLARSTESVDDEESASESSWQALELAGVQHSYRVEGSESSFVLGPINLTFHPGELVFLTGGNGSGKTTLAKLLTGLYLPESGEIRVDGRPVTGRNRDSYRQNFSVVFSDFYLFESLLGLKSPELDNKAREFLTQLQLSEKLRINDGALSTTDLSQGQQKRLALLTAYLEDRSFYIFDEWAADQDPVFKSIFYLEILPQLKVRGKTILVISHDDKYYHLADRLIRLDYGKLEYDKRFSPAQASAETLPGSASYATGDGRSTLAQ
jgi:putative pyoverdin transport system ATP-binding/permease protein